MAHDGFKQRSPLRNSFIPSRRHSLQTDPRYRATDPPPLSFSSITRQTLRRLGGRHPLCVMGVTSLIDLTSMPAACMALTEDSRPAPGPVTRTSSVLTPCSFAAVAAA